MINDYEVRSMISIPGSLSFAKLAMVSSAPEKSAGDARYASQDPFTHSLIDWLPHTISTPKAIRSALFLRRRSMYGYVAIYT